MNILSGVEMNYKNLDLDPDLIQDAIQEFSNNRYPSGANITKDTSNANYTRYTISSEGLSYFIDVYVKRNGKVTLRKDTGEIILQQERDDLCKYIIESELCNIKIDGSGNNRCENYPGLSLEDFNAALDILKEEYNFVATTSQNNDIRKVVKLQKDKYGQVTVIYYKTTNKAILQSAPVRAYVEVSSIFYELVKTDKIFDAIELNDDVDIDRNKIIDQFESLLPNASENLSVTMRKLLLKSTYNLNKKEVFFSCTDLIFDPFRALEHHIKFRLAEDYGVNATLNGTSINAFEQKNNGFYLKESAKTNEPSPQKTKNLESCYRYYKDVRHTHFHVATADPDMLIDDTIIIDDVREAHSIIRKIFELIDEYYE